MCQSVSAVRTRSSLYPPRRQFAWIQGNLPRTPNKADIPTLYATSSQYPVSSNHNKGSSYLHNVRSRINLITPPRVVMTYEALCSLRVRGMHEATERSHISLTTISHRHELYRVASYPHFACSPVQKNNQRVCGMFPH